MYHHEGFLNWYKIDGKLAEKFVKAAKKHTWRSMPPWMMERAPTLLNPVKGQYLEFDNGSMILSEAQGGEPVRGDTADWIVLDEFDFYDDAEGVWSACIEAIDGGGKLVFGGTVKQPGRLFHQMWEAAEEGRSAYPMRFYGCHSIPEHTGEWYNRRMREYAANPRMMYRENPRTPREAFMQSVANVFDQNVLRIAASRHATPTRMDVVYEEEESKWRFIDNDLGPLRIWELPKDDQTYVIGADPSRGLITGDYACFQVLCRQTGVQVASWHGKVEADIFGTILAAVGELYNWAYVGVEANHSTSAIDTMRRLKYPNIHRFMSEAKVRRAPESKWGFYMTQVSKNRIKDVTAGALRAGARFIQRRDGVDHIEDQLPLTDEEIEARADALKVILMCRDTRDEMAKFVYINERGAMEAKPHDDRVDAFMIACEMLRYVKASPNIVDEAPKAGPEVGTAEYMQAVWQAQKNEKVNNGPRNSNRLYGKKRIGRSKRSKLVW